MGREANILLSNDNWVRLDDQGIWFWNSVGKVPPQRVPIDDLLSGSYDKIDGNWAAILSQGGAVQLVSDRVRSIPLIFTWQGQKWLVTDSVSTARSNLESWDLAAEPASVFPYLGYTLGSKTLVDGLWTVQAGSSVSLEESGNWTEKFYGALQFAPDRIDDPEQFSRLFETALDLTIGRLVKNSEGRQLVVPLSGGIDSRLLLTWLIRAGAKNIVAFTYGKPGASEVEISRRIAQELDVPWFSVDVASEEVRRAWAEGDIDSFLAATWSGTSLPHVQDWFALREIREHGLVDPDAIMLPGHTVVGNMHDVGLLREPHDSATIRRVLLRHHSLVAHPLRELNESAEFQSSVESAFGQVGYDGSPSSLQSVVEWFNVRERQAKYINNSMRGYEFFGWDWALPMCEGDVFRVWQQGGESLTATREWYQSFTDSYFSSEEREQVGYYGAPNSRIPDRLRNLIGRTLRATRASNLLDRANSVRVQLKHPMSFESMMHKRSGFLLWLTLMRGQTLQGLWASLFLVNKWGSGNLDIVPRTIAGQDGKKP